MEECGCEVLMWGMRLIGHAILGIFLLHHHHRHVERRQRRMRTESRKNPPLVEILEHEE